MSGEKPRMQSGKKLGCGCGALVALFFGIPFVLVALFAADMEKENRAVGLSMGLVLTGVGLLCIGYIVRVSRRERARRSLAAFVGTQREVSLLWLAQQMGWDMRKTTRALREAIAAGGLVGGVIDGEAGYLRFPALEEKRGAGHTAICPRCGGGTKVFDGDDACCSYCGAPLPGENGGRNER